MDNRATRRAKKSAFKKQIKNSKWDDWEDKTNEGREKLNSIGIGTLVKLVGNSLYSVQMYKRGETYLLGIRRHDQAASCPWSHKQRIKNELLGEEYVAIEVFPKVSELIDQANMYWIWTSIEIDVLVDSLGGIKAYHG